MRQKKIKQNNVDNKTTTCDSSLTSKQEIENKTVEATDQESKMVKSKILRIILIVVGFISLALGTVGIVVPFVLPTVPFYLLTSFCFLKSSKRFNTWFLNSKLYKKHLENFAKTRCMIIYNELILLLFVSGMLMCALAFTDVLAMQIIFPILIACKYGYFIFKVKPISKPEFQEMMLTRKKENKDKQLQIVNQENQGNLDKSENIKLDNSKEEIKDVR